MQASKFIAEGGRSDSMACLARSLSLNPTNPAALTALASLLGRHAWLLPTAGFKETNGWGVAVLSPDGQKVLTASRAGTHVWDAQSGRLLTEHLIDSTYHSVEPEFSPDSRRVLGVAGTQGSARVWDVQTGLPVTALMEHSGEITSAHFSPDGARLVTSSYDRSARVWDAKAGKPLGVPLRHDAVVTSADFSPDGEQVITTSIDSNACVWAALTGQMLAPPLQHGADVYSGHFSPEGSRVVTYSSDDKARVWDARTGQLLLGALEGHDFFETVRFSSDGKQVIGLSGAPRRLVIWDAGSGRMIAEPLKQRPGALNIAISRDEKRVATRFVDRSLRVCDVGTGELIGETSKHVGSVRFGPDGKSLVTAAGDGTVLLWKARAGAMLGEPLRHDGAIRSAHFSSDGTRVVTASDYKSARGWRSG